MEAISKKTMETDMFMNLNRKLWDQLDRNIWPEELEPIKPSKWESMDANMKGKAVLENLGQIIYYVTVLGNESEQARKQGFQVGHEQSDSRTGLSRPGLNRPGLGHPEPSHLESSHLEPSHLELNTDSLLYSSHIYP